MADIPQAAINAAADAMRGCNVRWATAVDDPEIVARAALEAAEEVWPHDPPKRDLTGTTAGEFGRGPQQHPPPRHVPPRRRYPFGFTPEVSYEEER